MNKYTYIELLVEDASGKNLLKQVMKKYVSDKGNVDYRIHGFKGIGKLPSKVQKTLQIKSKSLLENLPKYLKGMDASLKNVDGNKAIFVVLDSDDVNCKEMKQQLVQMYHNLNVSVDVFFCIAIEEMEAWLLGDKEAVLRAYPSAKQQLLQKYVPDSIVGTWERLADIVYKGGVQRLKKDATSYYEIGLFKIECAEKIGAEMNIRKNSSPSFNYFIEKLDDVVMS